MNVQLAPGFREGRLVDVGPGVDGVGRRLEEFAGILVDRPLPHARGPRCRPDLWAKARAIYSRGPAGRAAGRGDGGWTFTGPLPDPWTIDVPLRPQDGAAPVLTLEIRPAPSGQVGVFLEQIPQWRWLAATTPAGATTLSLFGHSGAATLAMAAAGARVVHVDASRQAIALARRNAAASGLADAPIRWVCEDAATFVAREVRRGARYDGAVLDPPSWGHGPGREPFAIDRHLGPLVADLARLLCEPGDQTAPGPLLLTCHSPRWHHRRLHDTLAEVFPRLPRARIQAGVLSCSDAAGRPIQLGDFVRVAPPSPAEPPAAMP